MIEEGTVYTRGEHYGDPLWIVEDYGDGLYLVIFDYSRGKRSSDYRIYTTTFRETTKFIALDPEDQEKFKMVVSLALVNELRKRATTKYKKKEMAELWRQSV